LGLGGSEVKRLPIDQLLTKLYPNIINPPGWINWWTMAHCRPSKTACLRNPRFI
jgi:hypothetical protein